MAKFVKVTMTIPRLTGIPGVEKAKDEAGEALAKLVRRQLTSGRTLSGDPIPSTRTGEGRALYVTGELIRSIKYNKSTDMIAPNRTRKSSHGRKRPITNQAILLLQMRKRDFDPLGVARNANQLVNQEASKQLRKTISRTGLTWRPLKIR